MRAPRGATPVCRCTKSPRTSCARSKFSLLATLTTPLRSYHLAQTFLSLQIAVLPLLDSRYTLMDNAAIVHRPDGQMLLHVHHDCLVVVAGGAQPRMLLNEVVSLLEGRATSGLQSRWTTRLCPRCVQGVQMYTPMDEEALCCEAGHALTPAEFNAGALYDPEHWSENCLWTPPLHGSLFAARNAAAEAFIQRGALRMMDLTQEMRDAARKKECAAGRRALRVAALTARREGGKHYCGTLVFQS